MLTAERLHDLLDYDPDAGVFRWRVTVSNVQAGSIAGSVTPRGYMQISIDGRLHMAHRLAFLWMTGEGPADEVDHVNCSGIDNRWANLRPATRRQNNYNQKKRAGSTSAYKGVVWDKDRNQWRAQIRVDGRQTNLGRFDRIEDAHAAYCKASAENHGDFARVA